MPVLAPATRVASRKLGPIRGSSLWDVAWATSTLASTCGRWLTTARRLSWVVASMATGRAPRATIRRCRRSYSTPDEAAVGVRYQSAPSNRSGRACSTPEVSAPAIGWPPTNRSSSIVSTSVRLTEPTSVTTQSAGAAASASRTWPVRAPTGAQQKQASAPSSASASEPAARSMAPAASARSSRSAERPWPTTSTSSSFWRAAWPIEPPIRPAPRTAIRIRPGQRPRAAPGRRPPAPSSTSTVVSQAMQASVMDWP